MTEQTPSTTAPEDVELKIARYVKIRDAVKQATEEHKAKIKPAQDFLEQVENELLALMHAQGLTSVKTKAGTAYTSKKASCTIADGEVFRKFIVDHQAWDMVDWKANPTATTAFVDDKKAPPPGVNYSVAITVGVRRA